MHGFMQVKDKVNTFPLGQEDIIQESAAVLLVCITPGSSAFTLTPSEGDPFFYTRDCIGVESTTVNNQYVSTFHFNCAAFMHALRTPCRSASTQPPGCNISTLFAIPCYQGEPELYLTLTMHTIAIAQSLLCYGSDTTHPNSFI